MPQPRVIAGRYEVLESLCSDVRGEELRARDRTLGREVLLVRRSGDPQLVGKVTAERALREARALAGLRHRAIQKLHDVVEDENGPTLVLEPVAGETLATRLAREERLAPEDVRHLGAELADALAAVHGAGAVHRDVCEENVVLRGDGAPCLTGFRLAKPVTISGATSIQYSDVSQEAGPSTCSVLPRHPAPEQLAGEAASARTDLFALGCVLYRAATGRVALPDYPASAWRAPADPARLAPGLPASLCNRILSCLARSPVGRPQSALELRDALRSGSPAPSGGATSRGARRPAGVLAVAAALVLAFTTWRMWPRPERTSIDRGVAPSGPSAGGAFSSGFRESHALLIGIGETYAKHGFQPLANAVHDVVDLEKALDALTEDHWKTRLMREEEASFDGIRAALAELEDELQPEDRVLVYFAGHGEPNEHSGDSGWLIPADAETLEHDPARLRWLPFDAFTRFLSDATAKHVMLALDCCYGGRVAASRSAGPSAYEERFTTEPAHVVLASGRPNEKVSDGTLGGHSPFAEVFLDALRPGGGAITSSMLYSSMLKRFTELGVPQTPVLAHPEHASSSGEFVFLLGQ